MMMTGERTRRRTCPSAKNSTRTDPSVKPGLRAERPATSRLSHIYVFILKLSKLLLKVISQTSDNPSQRDRSVQGIQTVSWLGLSSSPLSQRSSDQSIKWLQLFVCLYVTTKMYGGVKVELHLFLTLALDAGK
jgi:hypothetical protein